MTFIKRNAVFILLSSVMVMSAGAQSKEEKAEHLFYINKKPVTTAEFVYLYKKNHQHKPDEFTLEKIEAYLDLFINYKLKVEEALSRGMDTTESFRKEYRTYRDELLKPYTPDVALVDSLVRLTYERLREEVNASHILIRISPDAKPADTVKAYERIVALRNRALAGEDFGALAAAFSEEPGAENTKGNLGFFTAMQMVFPFEEAAYQTPVGGISAPVRTQFGYHLVKVISRQPSRGEVEVSHIMIRAEDTATVEAAKNTIFDIFDRLQKGMKWEELCAEYSEDVNTKSTGGRLRPFGVGTMASMPAFQQAAFALEEPGEISDPVQTQFGWHILRLESRMPLPSFEEIKPSLTQRVSRDDRVRISKEALREKMRREFGFEEYTPAKAMLFANADHILRQESLSLQGFSDSTLFVMGGQVYRVRDFLKFIETDRSINEGTTPRQKMEELLTRYMDDVQLELLEERVKKQSPDYKWLINEYYEGILLFEIMEQEVWNRAMEDSTGQRNYFTTHASKYVAGERMVGKIYHSNSAAHIGELKEMLAGDDENAIGRFMLINRIRADSGAFEQKDRAIFSKVKWQPGMYETSNNGMHYLIVIDRILSPGRQTFEEARASIITDYQTFLEDSWIRELKRKFAIKVNKKAKKRAFAQLINSKG